MNKLLLSGLFISIHLLLGCTTPNSNSETPATPSSTAPAASGTTASGEANAVLDVNLSPGETQAEAGAAAETGVAVTESRNLSRAQFLRAMACAEAKSEESNKIYYSAQATAFSSAETEAQFNQIMQAGGRTQFGVYGAAVKLGCTG